MCFYRAGGFVYFCTSVQACIGLRQHSTIFVSRRTQSIFVSKPTSLFCPRKNILCPAGHTFLRDWCLYSHLAISRLFAIWFNNSDKSFRSAADYYTLLSNIAGGTTDPWVDTIIGVALLQSWSTGGATSILLRISLLASSVSIDFVSSAITQRHIAAQWSDPICTWVW